MGLYIHFLEKTAIIFMNFQFLFLYFWSIHNNMPYPKSNAFEITYSIQASPASTMRLLHLEMLSSDVAGYLLPGLQLISPVPYGLVKHTQNQLSALHPQTQATHHWGSDQLFTKDVGFTFRESSILTFGYGQSRDIITSCPISILKIQLHFMGWGFRESVTTREQSDLGKPFMLIAVSVSWHNYALLLPPFTNSLLHTPTLDTQVYIGPAYTGYFSLDSN